MAAVGGADVLMPVVARSSWTIETVDRADAR